MTPQRTRPALRAAAAALGLAVLVTGCVQSGRTSHPDNFEGTVSCPVDPDPSITTSVRIGWQAIPNGDLVVKDLELLETCMPNAKISWSKMNSGGDVIQAFGSNSLDISQVGSSPAVKAASPPLKSDLKVVWISDVIGKAESLVVKDENVTALKDLEGGTIAVPFGSTSHYSLLTALREAGLDGKVQVINLAPDAILASWNQGEIDGAWIWEPTLSQLLKDGHTITSSEETAKAGAPTFDLVAGTGSFVEDNPDFMKMWTIAEAEGTRIIRDDPDAAATSLAVQLGVDTGDAKALLKGYTYPTAAEQAGKDYFGGGMAASLQGTAEFLADQGEVDAVADKKVYADMPYADAIEEAAK